MDTAGHSSTQKSISATTDKPSTLAEVCTSGTNLASCIKEFNSIAGDGMEGIYYHDGVGSYTNADQEAGDNSYRFSGANPNNYICFGSNAVSCPEENLYRIIGVFDGQIKLIRSTSYGDYTWDSANNNSWSSSDINNILNRTFINSLGEWNNLIANHTWYDRGTSADNATVKEFYVLESSSTTWVGRIGLMYPSDYGYAASPANWTTGFLDYDNNTNRNNNWMYVGVTEWTMTPVSSTSVYSYLVNSTGYVGATDVVVEHSVRQVFFLENSVTLTGGIGTVSDPYIIAD